LLHAIQIQSLHHVYSKDRWGTLADPGFDLRGGVDFVNRGGGRKSFKVLKVKVKVILKRVLVIFILHLCLKLIASEASEEKMRKISVLGIKKS